MATHFIRTSVLALCALASAAFAACSPFGEEAGGSAEVTVHIVPDGFVQSRSSFSWKDDAIRDIQVVVTTEDGSVHDVLYSDSPTDLQFTGTAGCLYKLWAAANIGGKVEVGCLEDFTEGTRHVSQAGIAASGMPMYSDGSCDIVVAAGENHASIPLTRMMARVDFSIDTHLLEYPDNFSVSSVSICSPVDAFIPFTGAVAREHYGQPDYDFDSASASDISLLNSGGTIRLYAFENMQGTLLPGNTDPWQKVPSSIGGAGPYCTYLEVVCDYETDSETGSGITYRMYLGKDATTNFDVMRNTVYILTLVPTEEEIHGGRGSWKIETGEWEDTVEAELILTPSYLEIAEGETGRVSSRFHLTWPDGRTEDQPTTCDWNVVGMGYRHVSFKSWQSFVSEVEIYGKSHGTAVISASSGYGNRTYTAEMTVAVLEKTTEPIYTKEYEYELIVSPESATLAEDETAEFQAVYITREYTLADGVRVSDEPSAVTEDDVTEIAYWSVKSGSEYVTNNGQGSFAWASGPGSATVEAKLNDSSDTATITTLAHDIIYTKEYEYELVVSPESATIAEGETAEFKAVCITREYTLADGVRVSDEPSAVTEDDVTEIAYWSVKSGNEYVTNKGQGEFAWASGPGSATIEASLNDCTDTATINTLAHDIIYTKEYEYELVVSPESATLAEDETAEFKAVYITREYTLADGVRVSDEPSAVTEDDVTEIAYWSVKSGAEYVTDKGRGVFAWASGPGSATIEARLNECSDTVTITTLAHDIIYTKEYEYELVVSPESATLAEGKMAEFQAVYITREHTLADGVRVSDEPSAVTEDDVTVLAAWDIVNGGAYVTNQGQGAFEWLSGPGTATVSAMFEGCSDTAVITCDAHIPVIGYRYEYGISPTESAITVGETEEYTVTKYTFTVIDGVEQPGYTSEILPDGTVEWSSSDASVATVTNGIATGKDYGTTVITAAIDQEHSVSAELSVRHTFFFTGASTDVATPGESVTLYYETTLDPDDISFEFSEAGFSDTFHDASSVIVSVSSAAHAGITCTVTGGNGSKKATDTISISTPKEIVTYGYYVQITPTNATIKVGQSQPFNAECFKIKYINGVEVEHDLEPIYFSWTSEDNTVAIISTTYSSEEHEAIVSGRSAGTVTITATCMYGSASAVLTVEERLSIVSMTMDGAQVISSAHPGHYHYTCTVIYSDGTQFNSDDDPQYFDWRIDPHSEHQADGDGDYSFNRPGEYVIDVLFFDSATGLRESISYTVSVVDPLYEYVSGRLVLLESSGGYDTYGVYLDVHEDLTGTDDTFGPFTGNSCTIGNLYFTLAWSYANGSTWDGCTNVVPKGSTVRVELYVNGKFAGLLN